MEAEGSSEISSPTRLKIDESKTENEKCNEDNNQLTKDSQENNVRSWFNNLSGEDKALELSISDRKLIGMFLEMGCSDKSQTQSTTMDIMKHVKVQDLERIYAAQSHSSLNSHMIATSICRNKSKGDSSSAEEEVIAISSESASPITSIESGEQGLASVGQNAAVSSFRGSSTEHLKDNTPAEEIISDAFRIQESTSGGNGTNSAPKDPDTSKTHLRNRNGGNDQEDSDELIRTTLHFKSGLSLRIPTRSESDKKVVQNAGKKKDRPKEKASASLSTSVIAESEQSNEVHQHVSFGALKAVPPTTNSIDEAKRKNAQRITNAKQSAARAMMASSSHASSVRLLKNLRFVFNSASEFNDVKAQSQPARDSQKSVEEESIVLTIDPSYLSEGAGMQFFNDVENVVETELRKIKSSSTIKCKYLSDDFLIQKGNGGDDDRLPRWLRPFLQSSDSGVPLVLVLLAQVEYSIMQSYRQQKGATEPSGDKNDPSLASKDDSKNDGEKALPEHTTSPDTAHVPMAEASKKQEAADVALSVPQCLKPLPSNFDCSFISSVFEAYKKLKGQNLLTKPVAVPSFPMSSLCVQDFLLVPVEQALKVLSLDAKSIVTNHENINRIISKWNNIIDAAHKIVNSTKSSGKDEVSVSTSDHEVVKLFQDEILTTKKKKKKKKKKKRKGTNNNKNGNKTESETQVEKSKQENSVKAIDFKDGNNVISTSVTADSMPSIISDCPEKKEKGVVDNSNSDMPKTEESKSHTDEPTPKGVDKVEGSVSAGNGDNQYHQDNNDGGWETVEPKGGRGKKSSTNVKSNNEKLCQTTSQNSGRKNKGKSKSRNRNRQKDKEHAKANLDSHEVDIAKRGANTTKALMEERIKRQTAAVSKKKLDNVHGVDTKSIKRLGPGTLKDAIVGNLSSAATRFQSEATLKTGSISNKSKLADLRVKTEKRESLQLKKTLVADQNTASTVQETISATSRSFAFGEEAGKRLEAKVAQRKSLNEVTTNATETRENSSGSSTLDDARTPVRKSSAPPLQTLVGPGNFNSANSSVASSLEAPHATRHRSNKLHSSREDDVGYHLLKVCERLSGDMNTFMARRALALSTRRQERGALLSSLEETVQSIWADQCRVEMYGSCATQLDLPSSDLDVVVCGLDQKDRTHSFCDDISESGSHPPTSLNSEAQAYANQFYPPLSANGTRVIRLATELERVPWVVQVKAIPTASVPVIKILADPSRLPGAAGMDWMLHQQQMAAAAVAAAEMNLGKMMAPQQSVENCDKSSPQSNEGFTGGHSGHINHHIASMSGMPSEPPSYHTAPPPWRGADVMNGLLSLDITFEGPEHGGLGSTAFSARLVQDACNETGLPPESTPAVQVLMIIKEMLAQRRLNEPFSGGLSSYAILLLVGAVVEERRIIRKEIERVEKQRQAVESSAVNDEVIGDSRSIQEAKKIVWPAEKHSKKVTSVSSWASIAMKPSSIHTEDDSHDNGGDDSSSKKTNETVPKSTKKYIASSSKSLQNDSQAEPPQDSTLFPQGSNDVLEVLCSGEPTAGKLLMHFLLFYGRHFDPSTTCIDVSGTHHPDFKTKHESIMHSNLQLSPFTARKAGGTYNPVTDVYTVDPIIVYDPLEGAESNNVARSCYAWSNIQWAFGQCYNTLSGVVELGAGSNSDTNRCRSKTWPMQESSGLPVGGDVSRQVDDLSPLLELLLSF